MCIKPGTLHEAALHRLTNKLLGQQHHCLTHSASSLHHLPRPIVAIHGLQVGGSRTAEGRRTASRSVLDPHVETRIIRHLRPATTRHVALNADGVS
jgi:hypothetical protein